MKRNERNRKRRGAGLVAGILCLALALGTGCQTVILPAAAAETTAVERFVYRHDPRLNPKAMEDVQVDPAAIYGFSPTPDGSLRLYVDFGWTDPKAVEKGRQERIFYHESVQSMYDMLTEMRKEGKSTEEIARAVSAERNRLRIASYDGDPEGLATMKARNLEKYGREDGPTPDEMYQQYGAWETVIEKAFSVNMGMDVCLGLYDEYYPFYLAMGSIPEESEQAATREYAVAAFVRAVGRDRFPEGGTALSAFRDAGSVSVWYREELASAAAAGILRGDETGSLRPGDEISRVEAFVLLSRCLPELTPVRQALPFADLPGWAREEVDRLSAAGLVEGSGVDRLGAADPLTVEQVGILASRLEGLLTKAA